MSGQAFFETTYTPDYREMLAVARTSRRYHYTTGQRGFWWGLLAIYMVIIAIVSAFGNRMSDAARPFVGEIASYWVPVAVIVGFAVVFFLLSYGLSLRLSAKWLTERKPPEPLTMIADASRIRWEGASFGTWVAWSTIERLFVTPDAVCMLYGGNTLYLPRRVFADEAALREFIGKALASLTDTARGLSEADPMVRAIMGR